MKNFTIIAAMDLNRGIGKDNDLPWHLSADLKHFARTTTGNTVIMGGNTWISIPEKYRPFKNRLNIVISHLDDFPLPDGVLLAHSIEEALTLAEAHRPDGKAFIIGGGYLFKTSITHDNCEELILTEIQHEFDVDTYFPELPVHFTRVEESKEQEEKDIRFKFVTYKVV
jgi:dihydrofolate reductase